MKTRSYLIRNIFNSTNLFALAVILWLLWLWRRRHFYKFCWNFPTWWGYPLIGIYTLIIHPSYIIPRVSRIFKIQKSDNVCVWAGLYPIIITKDLDFVDFILTRKEFLNKAPKLYHPMSVALQGGLITNSAKDWLPVRPLLETCFKSDVLLSLFPIFNKQKSTLIAQLKPLANGEGQQIMQIIYTGLLELTMQTTMGNRASQNKKVYDEFVESIKEAMDSCCIKMYAGFINLEWLSSFYKWNEIKTCRVFIDNLIKQYLKEKESDKTDDGLNSNIFIKHAIKLYENNQLTRKQISGESCTIFSAAFETTANAVYSTFVLLAMHPDIQEIVYEELKSSITDPNREINYEDFSQLHYFDMVLKEVMRLMPPVPMIGRQITKDTKYKKWNTVIPKEVQVTICVYHLHRHTGIWGPDAAEFRPSRFSDENLTKDQRRAFIPFSKGYRSCLGNRYAMFAMKIIVAGILLNYQFATEFKYQDLRFNDSILLRYLSEPLLSFKRRKP